MSYEDELDKTLALNVVILINGVYYAIYEPDSGLSIDEEFLVVKNPKVSGTTVDVRNSNTPIGSLSFQLVEFEGDKTSSKVMIDDTQMVGKSCKAFVGHRTGSFDFSDYIEIANTRISTVKKIANGYSFTSKEVTNLINEPALNVSNILETSILSTALTLSVNSHADYRDSGIVLIDEEFIAYTSKDIDGKTLLGLSRGVFGTSATEHEEGAEVSEVTSFDTVNPIDIILQILLSKDGDGTNHPTYDVVSNGLGISPDDVNISNFESKRDENFLNEEHLIRVFNADNMLQYLEETLLPSTNLRFTSIDGKIDIALIDQVDFGEEVPVVDETSILRTPTWQLDGQKVYNVVEIKYDYNPATQRFSTVQTFKDADSIATFGEKKPLKLKFKSVTTALNGASIAQNRSGRLLGRLSTVRGKVSVNAHFDSSDIPVGSNVQVVHRYLPQQGGTLGFSDQLEVMSRDIDLAKGTVKLKLEFTSYTGIRIPFIAPFMVITDVQAQNKVEVNDASCFKVGYTVKLFKRGLPDGFGNPTEGNYLPDAVNTIQLIEGNIITFENNFVTTLEDDFILKVADYDEASTEQKARYAFIGENAGFFSDGSKSYQVIF